MKSIFTLFLCLILISGFSQTQTITLSFLSEDAITHEALTLDSVIVHNATSNCDTSLFGAYPSLVLTYPLGFPPDITASGEPFTLQNVQPNPFNETTLIEMSVRSKGSINFTLSDMAGKVVAQCEKVLQKGDYRISITSSIKGAQVFSAITNGHSQSVKLVNYSPITGKSEINPVQNGPGLFKSTLSTTVFTFHKGDQLIFTGVKTGYLLSQLADSPTINAIYTFQLPPSSWLPHPIVATTSFDVLNPTTAMVGGNVLSDEGAIITSRGICWSSSPNPNISGLHTVENPGLGEFTSTLTGLNPNSTYYARAYAINMNGTGYGYEISFTTPDSSNYSDEIFKLAGDNSKTWKLLRVVTDTRFPLEVGPWDHSIIWWAMGQNNEELANRPCMMNDEWTFNRNGVMTYDAKGDYWAETGVFMEPVFVCRSTESMTGLHGEDLSAWGGGNFTYHFTGDVTEELTVSGKGAFIGFLKLANGIEVSSTNPIIVPDSVRYNLVKLSDDVVDTLVIEGRYQWDGSNGGYWRFVLVHYDNPEDEPPIPGFGPTADFSISKNDLTVTCNNSSTNATSFIWDFGDGETSTELSPVHTYATEGFYSISLSAISPIDTSRLTHSVFLSVTQATDALIRGGAWHVTVAEQSVFVGPEPGSNIWWSVPKAFLDGSRIGTSEDWSCMTDDLFQFSAGGTYSYLTMGSARNDGYFGDQMGCVDDAYIASTENGAKLGSGIHTYTFVPGNGTENPKVILTNGAGKAAFMGFYKGFNGIDSGVPGGDNISYNDPPNGGSATNTYEVVGYANNGVKEFLLVSVDYSYLHDRSAAWSVVLER